MTISSNLQKSVLATLVALFVFAGAQTAFAGNTTVTHSLVGVQGYDLVSYHSGTPARGNGNHVAGHNGVTYQFANAENKAAFQANPAKYIPAYGGYCAYGVSVGKKFVGDPEVWKIVDGTLYLNLDKNVQNIWNEDIPGYIQKANTQWETIVNKAPSEL